MKILAIVMSVLVMSSTSFAFFDKQSGREDNPAQRKGSCSPGKLCGTDKK